MSIYSAARAVGDEARRSCELLAVTPLRLSRPGDELQLLAQLEVSSRLSSASFNLPF